MADKTTGELQQKLMERPNINSYLSENQSCFHETCTAELQEALCVRYGLPKSELARRAGMSNVYLYQVLGRRRNPSRDRLLSLCIGLDGSLEETNQLLKQAAYAQLYPRLKRDAIIIHGLAHRHDLNRINDTLFAENEMKSFFDKMYSNIGGKLRTLAKACGVIGIVCAAICVLAELVTMFDTFNGIVAVSGLVLGGQTCGC